MSGGGSPMIFSGVTALYLDFSAYLFPDQMKDFKNLDLKINVGLFFHFEIHYLKFVCKIIV